MMEWQDAQFRKLRANCVRWFRRNGRDLPWRNTHDPYAIWVSEVMLQQTQVTTVLPYFDRFLKSYPDVASLAAAALDDVYHHWAGLGYYRRAKQLHAAAKRIVTSFQGHFPREYEQVRSLEGVGRYTAGAILSFAFDTPMPIVEANTQRLYSRLLALRDDPTTSRSQLTLWKFAEQLLPKKKGAGILNQSLMEIGSQICLPKQPKCDQCPLVQLCPTFKQQLQEKIPAPKKKKSFIDLREAALLIFDPTNRVLMRRCAENERWSGLWDFPRFDVTGFHDPSAIRQQIESQFAELYGDSVLVGDECYRVNHCVTKYRIQLQCYDAKMKKVSKAKKSSLETRWVSEADIKKLPLNSSGKKVWNWCLQNLHC